MNKTSPKKLAYITRWQRDNPEKLLDRSRRRDIRQTMNGLCRDCPKPLMPGRKHCEMHLQARRDQQLTKSYGISRREYNEMVSKQSGLCAICHRPSKLYVDHSHSSGKVRGLLCNSCNMGLGRFKDDPGRLMRAAEYLMNYYSEYA